MSNENVSGPFGEVKWCPMQDTSCADIPAARQCSGCASIYRFRKVAPPPMADTLGYPGTVRCDEHYYGGNCPNCQPKGGA